MGPPKDIPASELWLKLQELPRPSKVVDFPRADEAGNAVGQVRIRVLTQEEQAICTKAAEDFARKHLKEGKKDELGYETLYSDAVCVEILYRACRDVSDPSRSAFPSADAVRKVFTTEECAKLFEHYLTVQLELGPTRLSMSDEELEAWIDRLVEGGSAYPLDSLSSDLQKIVTLYMAFQLRDLRRDKSSAGSPADDSSTALEPEPSEDT